MCMTKEKYCVVPGGKSVRLVSLSGHICIIAEEPKNILDIFELEAKGEGCITEKELIALTEKIAASVQPASDTATAGVADDVASDVAAVPAPVADQASLLDQPQSETAAAARTEKIAAATIQVLNTGDPANFESNGKPKVSALASLCNFDVTGPERDAAYKAATKK